VSNAYDKGQEQAHDAKMQQFREAIPSHVRYVVAPGQAVMGRDGKLLHAGAHLGGAEDLAPEGDDRPAWRVFDDALWNGVIWENYAWKPASVEATKP
jgi:hypothetical protein